MVDIEGTDSDILERFDFELDDLVDKKAFSKALNDKLQLRQDPRASQNQIDSFFDLFDITATKFPDAGIRKIEFTRLGQNQVRFVLPERRGLFGIKSALDFFKKLGK